MLLPWSLAAIAVQGTSGAQARLAPHTERRGSGRLSPGILQSQGGLLPLACGLPGPTQWPGTARTWTACAHTCWTAAPATPGLFQSHASGGVGQQLTGAPLTKPAAGWGSPRRFAAQMFPDIVRFVDGTLLGV